MESQIEDVHAFAYRPKSPQSRSPEFNLPCSTVPTLSSGTSFNCSKFQAILYKMGSLPASLCQSAYFSSMTYRELYLHSRKVGNCLLLVIKFKSKASV